MVTLGSLMISTALVPLIIQVQTSLLPSILPNIYIKHSIICSLIAINIFLFCNTEEDYVPYIVSILILWMTSSAYEIGLEPFIIYTSILRFILYIVYKEISKSIEDKKDTKAIIEFNKGNYEIALERGIHPCKLNIPRGYVVFCRNGSKVFKINEFIEDYYEWGPLKYENLNGCDTKPLLSFTYNSSKIGYLIKKEDVNEIRDFVKIHPTPIGNIMNNF